MSKDKPESKDERLEKRLTHHARSITQLHKPRLSGKTREVGDRGEIEQLYNPDFLESEWKALREHVLPDRDEKSRPHPSEIDPDGLRYLETVEQVCRRKVTSLEERQEDLMEKKARWLKFTQDREKGDEAPPEVLQSIKYQVEETEEQLSLARYRHSLAHAMLTQIALFDTVLPWADFKPALDFSGEDKGEELTTGQRRAVVIGWALKAYKEEHDQLPDFSKKKELKEAFASVKETDSDLTEIEFELFHSGKKAIADSLKEVGCWPRTRSGRTAERSSQGVMHNIMNCAINYAERSDWKVPGGIVEKVKEKALEKVSEDPENE
ncbi:hypothetical protein GGQ00_003015 [Salinibacter ruber]|uniref:hypothetical protein n=1 Tax=Salinibacter ruber TaxID=146919 RepID=UPI002169717E|nr:hypothetical protein [Salinibacter ruber]MCS4044555.1 hypothetical protein [Salinibacter ruber]